MDPLVHPDRVVARLLLEEHIKALDGYNTDTCSKNTSWARLNMAPGHERPVEEEDNKDR